MVKVEAANVRAHFQNDHRNAQRGANPETPGHIDQFGIGAGLFGVGERLERHAADRATAGRLLPDLRVHGAGVDGAGRSLRREVGRREKSVRLRGEFDPAICRAEVVQPPGVVVAMRRTRRIDLHPANRIDLR